MIEYIKANYKQLLAMIALGAVSGYLLQPKPIVNTEIKYQDKVVVQKEQAQIITRTITTTKPSGERQEINEVIQTETHIAKKEEIKQELLQTTQSTPSQRFGLQFSYIPTLTPTYMPDRVQLNYSHCVISNIWVDGSLSVRPVAVFKVPLVSIGLSYAF